MVAGIPRDRLSNPDAKEENRKAQKATPSTGGGMAKKLSSMGPQPQNLPLSGELDRPRAALAGPISHVSEQIGIIHSPTMRGEKRSHFISGQKSGEALCRRSNFGAQPRKKPVPDQFECRSLGIHWRDRKESRPCFQRDKRQSRRSVF